MRLQLILQELREYQCMQNTISCTKAQKTARHYAEYSILATNDKLVGILALRRIHLALTLMFLVLSNLARCLVQVFLSNVIPEVPKKQR